MFFPFFEFTTSWSLFLLVAPDANWHSKWWFSCLVSYFYEWRRRSWAFLSCSALIHQGVEQHAERIPSNLSLFQGCGTTSQHKSNVQGEKTCNSWYGGVSGQPQPSDPCEVGWMRNRTWSETTSHRAEAKPRLLSLYLSPCSFPRPRWNLAQHWRVFALDWLADYG